MIWYQEQLSLLNAPVGATANLVGVYNHPNGTDLTPPVTIKLEINDQDAPPHTVVLFTHWPTDTSYEPTKDEVLDKYRAKLVKARLKATTTPLPQLLR